MFFDDNHLRSVADNLSASKSEKVIERINKRGWNIQENRNVLFCLDTSSSFERFTELCTK